MNFSNKNIIITGASSGIGKALVNLIAKHDGVKMVAVSRNIESIPKLPSKIFPFSADMSTPLGVDSVFEYAKNLFGQTDIFIANAGFAYLEELIIPNWKHIEDIYALNVTSVAYSLGKLNEQSDGKERQFVCTVSAVAFVPLHAYALYCSSKAALHQFIEAYRYEKSKNLTLTAIYPVATKTSFFDNASGKDKTPSPWPAQSVEVVASAIMKGIEKNKKRIYPSTLFRIFFPIGRAFPFLLKIYTWSEKRKTKKWLDN